jgi:phage tail-like protein
MAKRKRKPKTNPDRFDPYKNYNFLIKWEGKYVARFRDVKIDASAVEVVEVRDGTEPGVMSKVPGVRKTADVTLKRGVIDSTVFWNWIQAVVKRAPNMRRDIELAVLGDHGRELAHFVLGNAWPVKYVSADFKAKGSDVAIEELELTNEGITPARG